MSDFQFMLESHLSVDQRRLVAEVRHACTRAGIQVFLTGGALRDTLCGAPIAEIDFTVEGDGVPIARAVAASLQAQLSDVDDRRRSARLSLTGGARAFVGMACVEKFTAPGEQSEIRAASIHEDLRDRDFTINSIALSLSAASKGLLLDPNNGVGDIERKELRAVSNYSLYDNPVRLLRLHRFKVRLGFAIADRTLTQYANARQAELESYISTDAILQELRKIASEPHCAALIDVLDEENLLRLFSPALTGPQVNREALARLEQAKQLIPYGADLRADGLGLFLNILTERLTVEEQEEMASRLGMTAADLAEWRGLDAKAKKVERALRGSKVAKPSALYAALSDFQGDEILFLLAHGRDGVIQERIRTYLTHLLPAALEIADPALIAEKLDAPPPPPPVEELVVSEVQDHDPEQNSA